MSLLKKGSLIRFGGYAPPQPVYAPQFDGLTQYASALTPEELRIADGDDFEIGLTVRRDTWNSGGFALCSRQASSYGVNFYMSNNGDAGTGSIGVFGVSLSASGFSSGVEYDISLSRVGNRWALNVDGVEVASALDLNISAIPNITALSIMARDDNSFRVNGIARDFYLRVNGGLVYFNSLGGVESAIQSPSTGSSDIEIINHTNAMWVQI